MPKLFNKGWGRTYPARAPRKVTIKNHALTFLGEQERRRSWQVPVQLLRLLLLEEPSVAAQTRPAVQTAGRKVAWNHIHHHYQVRLPLQCLSREGAPTEVVEVATGHVQLQKGDGWIWPRHRCPSMAAPCHQWKAKNVTLSYSLKREIHM